MKSKKRIARQIYTYLNEEYFDGLLPMVRFKFVNDLSYVAGFTTYADNSIPHIEFNKGKYYTYDHVELMLHEMCHAWQHLTGGKDVHGKTFKEIAKIVSNDSGYKIEKYQNYFATEEAVDLLETGINFNVLNYILGNG